MATKKKPSAATEQPQVDEAMMARDIPLEYVGVEDVPLVFTDAMTVRHAEEYFVIDFYQNQQPLIMRPEDVMKVESVKSRCVGRLLMTPKDMKKLAVAIQTSMEKRGKQMELEKEGGEQ